MATVVFEGKEQVELFRIRTLIVGIKAELRGLRLTAKAPTAYSIAKREFNLKGNKESVLNQLIQIYNERLEKMAS